MWITDGIDRPRKRSRRYRCFLIRCWLAEGDDPDDEPVWRFAVRQAGRSEPDRCFARMGDVEAYLGAELALCADWASREPE